MFDIGFLFDHIGCNIKNTCKYSDIYIHTHTQRSYIDFSCSTMSFTENVALRGKATQSDQYEHIFGMASNAIDGNHNPNFGVGSCSHTDEQRDPWWRVDLLESYVITSITVTNRGDCCEDRLNGLEIHIGNSLNDDGLGNPKCVNMRDKKFHLTKLTFLLKFVLAFCTF